MVKEIVRDIFFLAQKSEPATKADIQVGIDLQDTLKANRDRCVGLAANMIGVKKNIIIVNMDFVDIVMFNPIIVKKDTPYETEEGCLSLLGGPRKCKRYKTIKVKWQTAEMQVRIKTFTGFPAQIIQHEVDHCDGILI